MEIPYTVTARPDTGLWNAKVGIWLFLASEVMLFGGLFSSYIFLRLGADYPWPMHELGVLLGFINTIILIASSVFVVYAWVALKMRQWRRFQFWMALVLLCAGGFLVIKSFEYRGKFAHYHARLSDDSIVSGHLDHDLGKKAKSILFDASHVVLNASSGSHFFLKYLENRDDIRFTAGGEELDLDRAWFANVKDGLRLRTKADQLAADGKQAAADKIYQRLEEDYKVLDLFDGSGQLKVALSQPGKFVVPRSKVLDWTDDTLNFTRALSTTLEGKLESAVLKLEIDELDLREYLRRDDPRERAVADAEIFKHFDDEADGTKLLADFNHHRDPKVEAWEEAVSEWKAKNPDKVYEEKPFHDFERVYLKDLHADTHEGEVHAASGGGAHEDHPTVTIPFEEVEFFSNFGPRKNPFYAIYFTMTGLHGLHVLGGMLVLGYFMVRGRRLYLKNPEHMANRVEVGGLFWHFVDLVWIFLFPIFYLM